MDNKIVIRVNSNAGAAKNRPAALTKKRTTSLALADKRDQEATKRDEAEITKPVQIVFWIFPIGVAAVVHHYDPSRRDPVNIPTLMKLDGQTSMPIKLGKT